MATKLEWSDDILGYRRIFVLHIDDVDYENAQLGDFDRALLDDIDNGKPSSTPIADRLLGLETIVRRIEEAKSREAGHAE